MTTNEGKKVQIVIYTHKPDGEPMFDSGTIVVRDGVEYVTFDDYDRYREGKATSHLIPLTAFKEYTIVE